ncbi:MAG: formate dehydrogenase accessory sulfurtransferase FdhD [Pseudomonadota bacterium]
MSEPAPTVILPGARRALAQEVPVALVFDGTTSAVLMSTPQDIQDLGYGFALTEELITDLAQVSAFEIATIALGMEARFWLSGDRSGLLKERRRLMAGPIGCGLCGIDSLEQANRRLPVVSAPALRLDVSDITRATALLRQHQPLHDQTGALHAAGFFVPGQGMILAREDVGRHNALDKLIGGLALRGTNPADGAFVLSSRVSLELIQKTAIAGCGAIIAASAPTALAVELATSSGITLVGLAKSDRYEVFSHPDRVQDAPQVV